MNNDRPPTAVMLAVVMFATVTVGLMAALAFYEKDTSRFINLITILVPTTVGLVFVTKRVDDVMRETKRQSKDIEEVKHQTNGKLEEKFDVVNTKLDEMKDRETP